MDVFWTSYVRSVYVLYLQGDNCTIIHVWQGPKYASVNCENVIGFKCKFF